MDELERVAARRGQPDAGDPRGRPGLRDGRRDQRPPARRLGRAPRAHHGLTAERHAPSAVRQRLGRSSWRPRRSRPARPGHDERARIAPASASMRRRADAVSDSDDRQVLDRPSSKTPAVGRVVAASASTTRRRSADETAPGRLGLDPDHAIEVAGRRAKRTSNGSTTPPRSGPSSASDARVIERRRRRGTAKSTVDVRAGAAVPPRGPIATRIDASRRRDHERDARQHCRLHRHTSGTAARMTSRAARPPSIRRLGKVHHVALIVASIETALGLWRDTLGLELETVMDIPARPASGSRSSRVGESKIELVEPTDDTTGVARFLASKGEGFHHVCFEVRTSPRRSCASRSTALELIDTAPRRGAEGPVAFLHPRSCHGRPGRAHRGARRAGLDRRSGIQRRLGAADAEGAAARMSSRLQDRGARDRVAGMRRARGRSTAARPDLEAVPSCLPGS